MKLNDILSENLPEWWKPTKMTDDEIIAWCEKNASKFLANKSPIYRGVKAEVNGLYNTDNFNRTSVTSSNNLYNIWIDNHPDWSSFPKRSKALIGTNDDVFAKFYGGVHYLIPADNVNIGICPANDIWNSFKYPLDHLFVDITSFNMFILRLNKMGNYPPTNSDWSQIQKYYKAYDIEKLLEKNDDNYYTYKKHKELAKWMEENHCANIFELLLTVFSPNHFEHCTGGNYKSKSSHTEVWMSGDVIQLSSKRINKSDTLEKFFGQYYSLL